MIYLIELAKKKQEKAKKKAKKNGIQYEEDPRNNVDINATGRDNWTALHYAARKGRLRVVQALVRSLKVKDINCVTKPGWTPLMMAAHAGHIAVCNLLIRYGARVDVKDKEGNTASNLASSSGFLELGQKLLKNNNSKEDDSKEDNSKEDNSKED